MKQVDSIVRWRDRPPGGGADEDRAAALTRDALASGALPAGLGDRELAALEACLGTERRARPPFWLRPAIVVTLVSISVASVMGYETGWFAPLRERLRFRSIPPVAPLPSSTARPKARAPHPALELAPPTLAPPPAPVDKPALAPAPVIRSVTAPPARKVALADTPPPPPPAVAPVEPAPASPEIASLEQAVSLLRGKHDAPAALAALDDHIARFPDGALAREARVARVDALLMLHRADEALRALEELPLDAHRRSTELQLIRGELRARTDCGRAEADFTAVLSRVQAAALEERALYGRAVCRSTRGNAGGAADDLRRYLDRFPDGAHAGWARRWLENR
jgi:TolA-binding protein